MAKKRAWSFSIKTEPTYGGNEGYRDEYERAYRYDNYVQYHAQVSGGDTAVIVVDDQAIGLAEIGRVTSERGTKTLLRCPNCLSTNTRRRRTVLPPYRCQNRACKAEFASPQNDKVEATLFTAHLTGFETLHGVSREDVRAISLAKGQTAIRPLDPTSVAELSQTGSVRGSRDGGWRLHSP